MTLANRYLSGIYNEQVICIYEQSFAALMLLPAMFLLKFNWSHFDVSIVIGIGVICTALAYTLFVKAQKNLDAQTVGIISGLEIAYGIIFAFLFLGEVPSFREIIGGIIILLVTLSFSFFKYKK